MKNLLKVFLGIGLAFNIMNYVLASSGSTPNSSEGLSCKIMFFVIMALFFSFQFIWR